MKKTSILLLLLIGLCLPLAANAQEQKMAKGFTRDSQIASDKGGSRGTMTVYKKVSALTSNKNYLIVSSQTANSDALALSQASSTASTITAAYVHINAGLTATGNAVYITSEGLEPSAVWKATSNSSLFSTTWNFSHSHNSQTYYIHGAGNVLTGLTLSATTSSTNWTYNNNSLSCRPTTLTCYITPSASGFSLAASSANVYLYEETSVTAYTVTASVSPSGIGTVTGAGNYVSGATCELSASTTNSEYVFVNWTVNGTVVSTSPTYSFTVSEDKNAVANFESTVTCPAPSNLTAGTTYGHSAPLTWTGEADSYNVQYRTISSGETQLFFDSFENGLGNWTTYAVGDYSGEATNWHQSNASFSGGDSAPHTGSYVAMSRSYTGSTDVSVDNWLITPEVTLNGILRFWVMDDGGYHEHYDVYVSTTGNSISDFQLYYEPGNASDTWTEVTVDLSTFNGVSGYIALRHTDDSKDYLLIDDFGIYAQRYGEWSQPISVNESHLTLTGLDSETAYQAQVQANCGGGDLSSWSNRAVFTTAAPSTAAPINLTVDVNSITTSNATASWQGVAANDYHQSYDLYYATSDVTSVPASPSGSNYVSGLTTTSYDITGLSANTEYHVWVRDYCGTDGYSSWTAYHTFTTYDDCVVPFSQSTTDITPSGATLNWDGMQSSYNARYRLTYNGHDQTVESFSGYTAVDADDTGVLPTGWKGYSSGTIPHISNNSKLGTSHDIISMGGGQGGTDNFLYMISNRTSPNTSYTILPQISHILSVSFNYAFENASYGTLTVGYCTENTSGSSFVAFNDVTLNATTSNTHITLTANDIATINQRNGYLAFRWVCESTWYVITTTTYGVAIDNVTIDYVPHLDSEWTTETNVNSPLTINGLVYSGEYEWQVQGVDCGGNGSTTDWSVSTIFTTLAAQEFTKTISPYNGDGGYYLIASPIEEIVMPSADNGIITNGNYDFYYFDQSDSESKEWVNYDAHPFNIVNGEGYLYANESGTTLTFRGTPYRGDGKVTLSKDDDAEFVGWNLVGNPFPETAYLSKAFYTMNSTGDELIAAQTNSVAIMDGVFVIADTDNETLTFTTTTSKGSMVALNLSKDRSVIDRAIVNFGEERTLPKFQLNPNHTKVYIPQDGIDYAVVTSEGCGEMPVNFKAESNGRYTLSFNSEEVDFAYLHLIDNMTGIETDLTQTPSYSFDATTTDYESRFKLVFATGSSTSSDTFAFYSNGNWVINNEGEATLQVIDINGRILKSESINGCADVNVNAAQGIYMLRLVNGTDVKVQKVVVR